MVKLPYVLQKENICRFDGDTFFIGDRRTFPLAKTFVACSSVRDIAIALTQMVTQGGGPLQVAFTTLSYCAHRMERGTLPAGFETFKGSAAQLIAARPTNTTMARVLEKMLGEISLLFGQGGDLHSVVQAIDALVLENEQQYDAIYHAMGKKGASLLKDGETVLTTCFAEHTFLLSLAYAQQEGKTVSVLASETRPYLQGARLTAPSLREMGIPVSLITDGMGANFLSKGKVGCYMTASDVVCMDGTVVNKTGTLANAIACAYYNVPYYSFSISPDPSKRNSGDLHMEMRDGKEVIHCMGHLITDEAIPALYPSFDSIPPSLVTGIITPKGILTPDALSGAYL
ncbi:putative translation initiation factor 2B subunit, eIF-2B alpha/beta/delta family [Sphaerochaeta pleomorpha str. Grapes]|uniref:Putative translation initiation factor 2B subunit, eIF-2B alpha/beta/delta family n=1 Tax=Sphaerochaeta pleomorpha (strain ATCC BAA-1885 / DSM 22778 / Grapes) TaxID=158190 RepID=G8QR88_SPHPG|nr:translation initiation factor 2 [Sphaerochaeta pleomorpha]AEV31023.1 putative translation initiation factor 2B subunit, eIF-2B alpha/beta/delta family [Sphaerochaeta pleomorpha str. Grapes]